MWVLALLFVPMNDNLNFKCFSHCYSPMPRSGPGTQHWLEGGRKKGKERRREREGEGKNGRRRREENRRKGGRK